MITLLDREQEREKERERKQADKAMVAFGEQDSSVRDASEWLGGAN